MRTGSTNPLYGSKAWKILRARCLKRDDYRCVNCGCDVKAKGTNRVDHVKSVKQFPELALDLNNLRTLCVPCDNARHSEKGAGGDEKPAIGLDGFPEGW